MNAKALKGHVRLWGEGSSAVLPAAPRVPILVVDPTEAARNFYFKQKFVGFLFAQNLAKANIKKAHTDDTLDEEGRFKTFRLDHDSKNAQLECLELFPYANKSSNHPLAPLHREGCRLMLKLLDFIEEYPEDHLGARRLSIDDVNERLNQAEHFKLNALLLASLTDKDRKLSKWEKDRLMAVLNGLAC